MTSGSIAATGLGQGDVILRIGETETSALTYAQAMDVIKNSGNLLQLSISKYVYDSIEIFKGKCRIPMHDGLCVCVCPGCMYVKSNPVAF